MKWLHGADVLILHKYVVSILQVKVVTAWKIGEIVEENYLKGWLLEKPRENLEKRYNWRCMNKPTKHGHLKADISSR